MYPHWITPAGPFCRDCATDLQRAPRNIWNGSVCARRLIKTSSFGKNLFFQPVERVVRLLVLIWPSETREERKESREMNVSQAVYNFDFYES